MKRIEDAPKEIQKKYKEAWDIFVETNSNRFPNLVCGDFFFAGYEAAIAERAKFDEQNGLIVKDIGEL